MKRKNYESPDITVVELRTSDIIMTSFEAGHEGFEEGDVVIWG